MGEQKLLQERKLVIDSPTRWNSTFVMLSTVLKFKVASAAYKERGSGLVMIVHRYLKNRTKLRKFANC